MKKMMMVFVVLFAMVGSSFGIEQSFSGKIHSIYSRVTDSGEEWIEFRLNNNSYFSCLASRKSVVALALNAFNNDNPVIIKTYDNGGNPATTCWGSMALKELHLNKI